MQKAGKQTKLVKGRNDRLGTNMLKVQ